MHLANTTSSFGAANNLKPGSTATTGASAQNSSTVVAASNVSVTHANVGSGNTMLDSQNGSSNVPAAGNSTVAVNATVAGISTAAVNSTAATNAAATNATTTVPVKSS